MRPRSREALLVVLAAGMLVGAGAGTLPPIPGSIPSVTGAPVGRRPPPPVVRIMPPSPPAPKSGSVQHPGDDVRGRTGVVICRIEIGPGERVVVMSGPAALVPGVTLLDASVAVGAEAEEVLVAVALHPHRSGDADPLIVLSH